VSGSEKVKVLINKPKSLFSAKEPTYCRFNSPQNLSFQQSFDILSLKQLLKLSRFRLQLNEKAGNIA